MNAETPQITASCYTSSAGPIWQAFDGQQEAQYGAPADLLDQVRSLKERFRPGIQSQNLPLNPQPQSQTSPMPNDKSSRRIVQVFIADPNENVPLDKSVLYTGSQKLTDLNDTELFFEVTIKELLDSHNAFRVTCRDKEASKRAGKDILMDPVKIRDLRMVVVTIAQF